MITLGSERIRDEAILVARILLVVLFLVFGWGKLTDYAGTVGYMAQTGAPLPPVAALVAIAVEFFVALALVVGFWTPSCWRSIRWGRAHRTSLLDDGGHRPLRERD